MMTNGTKQQVYFD